MYFIPERVIMQLVFLKLYLLGCNKTKFLLNIPVRVLLISMYPTIAISCKLLCAEIQQDTRIFMTVLFLRILNDPLLWVNEFCCKELFFLIHKSNPYTTGQNPGGWGPLCSEDVFAAVVVIGSHYGEASCRQAISKHTGQ